MPASTVHCTVKLRSDTANNWTSADPVLGQGEMGIEYDTLKFKIGNGVDCWNDITNPYLVNTGDIEILDKITHIGDTNTAIRFPANDTFTIETGGAEAFRVDSNQKILIGGPTASYANASSGNLQVGVHTLATATGITIGGTLTNSISFADDGDDQAGLIKYTHATNSLSFHTNGAVNQRMVIDSSGNIGIGTSHPVIYGSPTYHTLEVTGDNGGVFQTSSTDDSVKAYFYSDTNVDNARIGTITNHPFLFVTNATEKARIDSSGNFGIGTSSPVANDKGIDIMGTADASVRLHTGNTGGTSSDGVILSVNASNDAYLWNYENGSYIFGTNNAARMEIDSSGNVGINSTSPSYRLQLGNNTSIATATPEVLSLGATYSNTAGSNPKLRLWDDNTNYMGIGVSSSKIDYICAGAYSHVFHNDGSESIRVNHVGDLLIGTTTRFGAGGITFTSAGAIVAPQVYGQVVTSSPRDVHVDSAGLFGYVSSIRESKANIQLQSNVDWIYQLKPVTFNYRSKDIESGEYTGIESNVEYGLIAEDVQPICPELCFYDKTDNGQKLSGIHYRKLITPMLKALQDANFKIKTLEVKVAALEAG